MKADVVLISEPLYNPGDWIFSKRNEVAKTKNNKRVFAADISITVEDSSPQGLKTKVEQMVKEVQEWLRTKGLSLAVQKTEIMLLNCKTVEDDFCFRIGDTEIKPSPELKYLGVTFESQAKLPATRGERLEQSSSHNGSPEQNYDKHDRDETENEKATLLHAGVDRSMKDQ